MDDSIKLCYVNPDVDVKGNPELEEIYYNKSMQFETLSSEMVENIIKCRQSYEMYVIGRDKRDDTVLILIVAAYTAYLEKAMMADYNIIKAALCNTAFKVSKADYKILQKERKINNYNPGNLTDLPFIIDKKGEPISGCYGGYDNIVLGMESGQGPVHRDGVLVCANNTGKMFLYYFDYETIFKMTRPTYRAIMDAVPFKNWVPFDKNITMDSYAYRISSYNYRFFWFPFLTIKGIQTYLDILHSDFKNPLKFMDVLCTYTFSRNKFVEDAYTFYHAYNRVYPDSILYALAMNKLIKYRPAHARKDRNITMFEAPYLFSEQGCVLFHAKDVSKYTEDMYPQILSYDYDKDALKFSFILGFARQFDKPALKCKLVIDLKKVDLGREKPVDFSDMEEMTSDEADAIFLPCVDPYLSNVFYGEAVDLSESEIDICAEEKDGTDGAVDTNDDVGQMSIGVMTLESVIADLESKGFKRRQKSMAFDSVYVNTHLSVWLNANEYISLSKALVNGKILYKVDTYRDGEYYLSVEGNFDETAFKRYFAAKSGEEYIEEKPKRRFNYRIDTDTEDVNAEYTGKIGLNKYQYACYKNNKNLIAYPPNFFSFVYAKEYKTLVRKQQPEDTAYYALADFKPTGEHCLIVSFPTSILKKSGGTFNLEEARYKIGAPKVMILMRFSQEKDAIAAYDKLKKEKLLSSVSVPAEVMAQTEVAPCMFVKNYEYDNHENLSFIALSTMVTSENYTQDILEVELNL